MTSGTAEIQHRFDRAEAGAHRSMRVFFRRFDAVDHKLENVWIRWTYQPARPLASAAEFALVTAWRACYALERFVPRLTKMRERSTLNVYLGAWLAHSDLRAQIAALRNQAQYQTEG